MDGFEQLVGLLARAGVRFVVIGLAGANYYAQSGGTLFLTQDRDLLLPLDADNTLAAWRVCDAMGLDLLCSGEPLDQPRDRFLAKRVPSSRALVRATDGAGLDVDMTVVMAGFTFTKVVAEQRTFRVGKVNIPVARLSHIVESKRRAGRDKDRLFLVTHADAIRDLVAADERDKPKTPRRSRRRQGRSAPVPRSGGRRSR